ncbi:dUTPase-like protein [Neohortaea acidophila]|uniref:Deoxyuridine 5'-triphosphate nucleotidohydrolase n=1 Tax=Neohortaea acidophila TaxID=245834 RepID=A0A6A6PQV8_9PEZI|nr:dUTPase-like protein [Neohortaea acidophila]KAF2482325.1 dUTPase-like protein [Neohortaea acidophila]
MASESTPQPEHDIPSLPASPEPKRTKFTEPAPNLSVASILNDSQPTPTPATAPIRDPLESIPPMSHHTVPVSGTAPTLPPMATEPPPPALQVKFLSSTARAPTRSSAFAAGYDLYASKEATVPAWGKVLVDTDISIALPVNTYGRVAPRSGLASKHSIHTGAGVIDADYRGPVKVLLLNLSGVEFGVAAGDRIAQLIVERIYTPEVVVVDQLDETVRGAGGFGSTGGFGGALPPLNGVGGV